MFDVGFWELALIGLIALLVLGPERLPKAAHYAGHWIGRARRILTDMKEEIDREVDEQKLRDLEGLNDDLQSLQKEASELSEKASKASFSNDLNSAAEKVVAGTDDKSEKT